MSYNVKLSNAKVKSGSFNADLQFDWGGASGRSSDYATMTITIGDDGSLVRKFQSKTNQKNLNHTATRLDSLNAWPESYHRGVAMLRSGGNGRV